MLEKSSRAFRTISEAGEELDLKPHVLRFWEAKFSDLKPVTRAGGRRFYRPEDIDFLRGLRILLHDEKHKIKDVQKLIKLRGAQSVVDLGHTAVNTRPSRPIEQRDLVPERIKGQVPVPPSSEVAPSKPVVEKSKEPLENVVPFKSDSSAPTEDAQVNSADDRPVQPDKRYILRQPSLANPLDSSPAIPPSEPASQPAGLDEKSRAELEGALDRLGALRKRWEKFT